MFRSSPLRTACTGRMSLTGPLYGAAGAVLAVVALVSDGSRLRAADPPPRCKLVALFDDDTTSRTDGKAKSARAVPTPQSISALKTRRLMYAAWAKDFCFIRRDVLGVKRSFGIADSSLFFSRGFRASPAAKLLSGNASKVFIDSYENVRQRIWLRFPSSDV